MLPGPMIKPVDDESVLDELSDRIQALGFPLSSSSFGVGKANWKSDLRTGAGPAPLPTIPTAEDLAQLKQELENTRNALDETKAGDEVQPLGDAGPRLRMWPSLSKCPPVQGHTAE